MWMIIRDQVRRNRWQLALNGLVFANFLVMREVGRQPDGSRFDFLLCCIYSLWPLAFLGLGKFDALRIWRMLPFRESSLANLAWCMHVPIPAGIPFVVVLLLESLGLTQVGKGPLPMTWPLLVLLYGVLSAGAFTFASASIRHQLAQKRYTLYRLRLGFGIAFPVTCTAIALALMLNPTPTGWQDLQSSHFVGLLLGALLTLRSYSLRAWLLQPFKFQYPPTPEAPTRNDAPLPRTSILLAIARDFVTSARGMALLVIAILAYYYLWPLILTGLGLLSPSIENDRALSHGTAIGLYLLTIFVLSSHVTRFLTTLKTIRTLPLSAKGCVRLLISYPYVLSLIVVPCVGVVLSNGSPGRFSTVLAAGALIFACVCPCAMFLAARFGMPALVRLFMLGILFVYLGPVILQVGGIPVPSLPTPVLLASLLPLIAMGVNSYHGLIHLMKNNSDVYKPRLLPQHFDQGLGR